MNREYLLNDSEIFLVEALRKFDFLRRFGFVGEGYKLLGHERIIKFSNSAIDRTVTINLESHINVGISRKHAKLFSLREIQSYFYLSYLSNYFGAQHLFDLQYENEEMITGLKGEKYGFLKDEMYGKVLKQFAEFMLENLFPVIIGTKWIHEIVDIRKAELLNKQK